MAARARWFAAAVLFAVALIAFFTGRSVEERALAAMARASSRNSASPSSSIEPPLPSYRQLAVTEILGLPFADFYEALRSAPGEAREKWASELVTMPKGPRRTAAVAGFYKLLVQFDPAATVKAIREIEDVGVQCMALGSAVNAAPGFAMREMAELSLSLEGRTSTSSKRDYLSDVLLEWMLIDASAVAQFIDDHPEVESYENSTKRLFLDQQLISPLAALDPKAAREWIDRKGKWEYWEIREAFIEGWYENDGAAAVSYVLAHVEDPGQDVEIRAIVRGLYLDSKEEAAKFIQSLPEDKGQQALSGAFRNFILGVEEETGDTVLTQRAVASWMIEFPPAYWKGALSQLFGPTRKGDDDMLSWIEQLPPSLHEAVAAEYTPPYWKSTSEAIMGVLQVADPSLRDQLLRAMLKNLGPRFDEARATVTAAPTSSEQKNHLFEIIAAVKAEKDQDQGSEK
jgi:hypothetical protein